MGTPGDDLRKRPVVDQRKPSRTPFPKGGEWTALVLMVVIFGGLAGILDAVARMVG